jgi:pilus assembly protein CpaF
MPILAGENISQKFIAPTVAAAINLIVHISLSSKGVRRVQEISQLTGRIENDRVEMATLYKWNGDDYEKGLG